MRDTILVGRGYWGTNIARNLEALGRLKTIVDESPEVLADSHREYPGVECSQDYRATLENKAARSVFIATPAATHFRLAAMALEAGKDVFIEKPLATTVSEGSRLAALASAQGSVLMVGHILQYHPAIVRLRTLIRDGALGRVRYIYSNRLNMGKIRTEENSLWSFAPHDISAILALLEEEPKTVACQGGNYLNSSIADVTVSQFVFPSGVRGHIFVSWLHPFKEQRLVVVGSDRMAVFDDAAKHKLVLYSHRVETRNGVPTVFKAEGETVEVESAEPLRLECEHFFACVEKRSTPATDAAEGVRVLRVLDACQRSMDREGAAMSLSAVPDKPYFVHQTAQVDEPCFVGIGTKIWHFSHVMSGARIGAACVLGQNVNVDGGAIVGNNVKIQNNVSVYSGVVVEDDVFLGPSCVLTNVTNPRSQVSRHGLYEKTVLRRGCTIGANATIVCGITVGRYAFVAAGSVVTRNVPDYALVAGNPARQRGWMSRHGHRLTSPGSDGLMVCPESGLRYRESPAGDLRCLDLDENAPLPPGMTVGSRTYEEYKRKTPDSEPAPSGE